MVTAELNRRIKAAIKVSSGVRPRFYSRAALVDLNYARRLTLSQGEQNDKISSVYNLS